MLKNNTKNVLSQPKSLTHSVLDNLTQLCVILHGRISKFLIKIY